MLRTTILAAFCLALAAPSGGPVPVAADPPKLALRVEGQGLSLPEKLDLAPGRLGRIQVSADPKAKTIRWLNPSPDALDLIESETGRWAIVSAPKAGTYRVAAYTAIDGEPTPPAWCVVRIGTPDPRPDPRPDPEPKPPDPTPDPGPKPPPARAWVVVVEETAEAKADRGQFVSDRTIADYLKMKGWKARVVDKDVVGADGKVPADVRPYLDIAKGKGLPYWFIVDQDGTIRLQGAVPGTRAEFLKMLQHVGG